MTFACAAFLVSLLPIPQEETWVVLHQEVRELQRPSREAPSALVVDAQTITGEEEQPDLMVPLVVLLLRP